MLGRFSKGGFRDGTECAVKVVYAVEKVYGELLDGEVAGVSVVASCAVLEVAVVCYGAEVFVLWIFD